MIKTENLTKRYGDLVAVDSLSFQVSPGEILGFLGPNGAGKSTTMRMIAGFVPPTGGSVSVAGFDIGAEPVKAKQQIGYLPEGAPSYGEMTPAGFLDFIADIRGLSGSHKAGRIGEVVERLHLQGVLTQSIDTLSKGFKRRVGLAQAILHDPAVLILDEPTDGLDPNQKHEVRSLINEMSSEKIIVISTHILEEVHAVCNRALIIAQGRILADDTPAGLEEKSKYHNAVTLRTTSAELLQGLKSELRNLTQVGKVESDESDLSVTAFPKPNHQLLEPLTALANDKKWEVFEFHLESGRLDEVFRSITSEGVEVSA
ncbi:MAG: ABC transporter ATP-binding protein [Pseudomonadota bacterium]